MKLIRMFIKVVVIIFSVIGAIMSTCVAYAAWDAIRTPESKRNSDQRWMMDFPKRIKKALTQA